MWGPFVKIHSQFQIFTEGVVNETIQQIATADVLLLNKETITRHKLANIFEAW